MKTAKSTVKNFRKDLVVPDLFRRRADFLRHGFRQSAGQMMLMVILSLSTIFITGTVISVGVTKELRRMNTILDSVKAFYAADAGVEWKFYSILKNDSIEPPLLSNNASCCGLQDIELIVPENPGERIRIKSVGRSPASSSLYIIRRSIETNTNW
ncbi:MAG: hypothetical protein A2418_01570 [Candidatus Brennerbacteria bacterium RIFOXYC1_FULL_41_11]|uniref:Type 4 fimbrial biogenesis protein PilX N-terminal domain-containing protein n=1 Tax=Candidatus Brennerbacteria bacterium RIFOXYD1_FULL_41_16 TaxID=1797529 RepID=A0A1G1XL03_9BACT|nr:MAG: hypothetical protein A2418_01570 [Candidatus Brennerbacteria bacterium RIFOXYC1_FULL_41_11]OGY39370.1 MAG: hypothetical protein A2391_02760 [Candidatus Brennerbacteria bacterium RIFOXYB1_FULL_41_13]OGY39997.1 MAG: hypothetical protein A2570_00710 [Candidatus Brennerbacteria bacterium RIFOXYD1_FULL_41_16]